MSPAFPVRHPIECEHEGQVYRGTHEFDDNMVTVRAASGGRLPGIG
jgi:hypothetical protein